MGILFSSFLPANSLSVFSSVFFLTFTLPLTTQQMQPFFPVLLPSLPLPLPQSLVPNIIRCACQGMEFPTWERKRKRRREAWEEKREERRRGNRKGVFYRSGVALRVDVEWERERDLGDSQKRERRKIGEEKTGKNVCESRVEDLEGRKMMSIPWYDGWRESRGWREMERGMRIKMLADTFFPKEEESRVGMICFRFFLSLEWFSFFFLYHAIISYSCSAHSAVETVVTFVPLVKNSSPLFHILSFRCSFFLILHFLSLPLSRKMFLSISFLHAFHCRLIKTFSLVCFIHGLLNLSFLFNSPSFHFLFVHSILIPQVLSSSFSLLVG